MTDILSFDAIEPDRAYVRIGENRYPLAVPDDLGLVATVRIARAGKLMGSLSDDAADDPAEMDKLHRVLREALHIVLPSFSDHPCEYVDGVCVTGHVLNDYRVLDVIEAFNREAAAARRPRNRTARRKARPSRKSTGAKSSRASADSTAAGTG